jgi:hypothetical protein
LLGDIKNFVELASFVSKLAKLVRGGELDRVLRKRKMTKGQERFKNENRQEHEEENRYESTGEKEKMIRGRTSED